MLQAPNELGAQYNDVVSAQDVAVYGGLCALASFDRQELRTHVINNVSFRDFMEVYPEVRWGVWFGLYHKLHNDLSHFIAKVDTLLAK